MPVSAFSRLSCPLDGDGLVAATTSAGATVWRCAGGHSFDVAREGYVHLLPVQNKRSRDPGDSKAMVAARRRFLEAGWYQPIADAVVEATWRDVPAGQALDILDAGCGEGYYLRAIAEAAAERGVALVGLDISKWAIQAAAKRDRRCTWLVGSNANLPLPSAALDRVLCLFGFPAYSEFARVLRSGGRLLQVDAGPDHLIELRKIIYPSLRPAGDKDVGLPEGFSAGEVRSVRYQRTLDSAEGITDLLAMTPHLHRATSEAREMVAALRQLKVTVDVALRCYERQ
jgi:23S rRNA (guanine745-N1)-methyltransferase